MDVVSYTRFMLALVFVLGLIWLVMKLVQKYGLGHAIPKTDPKKRRLQVIESLVLDTKRRVILLRRDDREHLILLGAGDDTLIESSISPSPQETPLS